MKHKEEASTVQPGLLAVHSQSNRPDAPLDFNDPAEQAFDSRALTLPQLDVLATSSPVGRAYRAYCTRILGLKLPEIVTPEGEGTSLSQSLMRDPQTLEAIKQAQIRTGKPFILSVFDPTDDEKQLLHTLKTTGVDIIPELNYDVAARLGNKAGFREFCAKYNIPQLSGGVFRGLDDLKAFITRNQNRRQGMIIKRPDPQPVILKHPFGTAGEGLSIVQAGIPPTEEQLHKWEGWIKGAGSVVGEVFHPKGGEHALHIYIDPVTKKARVTGVYDQLTSTTSEGTQAHYGARSPMKDKEVESQLLRLAKKRIIPALLKEGYTGPACFDVLSHPLHFMELNTRAGANYYVHREVEQIADSLYKNARTDNEAFMFLASLDTPDDEACFSQFYERYKDVLQPRPNGTLILTNPGRHAFGKYDITAYSPYGIEEAERILKEGVTQIWGEQKAQDIFGKIHQRK